jgi:hypothetical protein
MRESGTRVFSRAGMTAALTPPLALALLQELSVDVRAAVVLGREGEPLAGDPALAPDSRDLLTSGKEGVAARGALRVARTRDGGAIAVFAGDFVLAPLLEHDLARVAEALVTGGPERPGTSDSPS